MYYDTPPSVHCSLFKFLSIKTYIVYFMLFIVVKLLAFVVQPCLFSSFIFFSTSSIVSFAVIRFYSLINIFVSIFSPFLFYFIFSFVTFQVYFYYIFVIFDIVYIMWYNSFIRGWGYVSIYYTNTT